MKPKPRWHWSEYDQSPSPSFLSSIAATLFPHSDAFSSLLLLPLSLHPTMHPPFLALPLLPIDPDHGVPPPASPTEIVVKESPHTELRG